MEIRIKKLNEKAVIPFYGSEGAAGMDIVPISVEYKEDIDCYVYHTGLAFEIPKGYAMFIFPRSSNRKTNAYLPNSVGILDSDYRGELMICFKNRTGRIEKDNINTALSSQGYCLDKEDIDLNEAPYEVNNKAIAQIVIMPYPKIEFKEVEELSDTERGEGGFGSTNNKFNINDIVVDNIHNKKYKITNITQYNVFLEEIDNSSHKIQTGIKLFVKHYNKL